MCRRVQVLRPRASTSGGQSAGRDSVVEERVGLVVVVEDDVEEVVEDRLARAIQSFAEVQERQLY